MPRVIRSTLFLLVLIGGVYGYLHGYHPVDPSTKVQEENAPENFQYEKCTSSDGQVYFGQIPRGVTCEKTERLTLKPTKIVKLDPVRPTDKKQEVIKPKYRCDGRQRCSQMTSCDEAMYFIRHCPNTKMDGDGDGVPCEKQWCN